MSMTSADRVEKRRAALRAQGLRPVQIWVPDTRAAGFDKEARRQLSLVEKSDANDVELMEFFDDAVDLVLREVPPYE